MRTTTSSNRLFAAAACVLLLACVVLGADPQPTPFPGTYVHDFAGVIPPEKREEINTKAKELRERFKTEIGIVTVETTGGEAMFDYSLRMARDWGIGSKDNSVRGLLIVVATKDRKTGFRTSQHIEAEIPDGITGTISRSMGQFFKQGDFGGGLSHGMDLILAREKEVFEPAAPPAGQQASGSHRGLFVMLLSLFALLLSLAALAFVVMARRRSRREREEKAGSPFSSSFGQSVRLPIVRSSVGGPSGRRPPPPRPQRPSPSSTLGRSSSRRQDSDDGILYSPMPSASRSSSRDDDSSSRSSNDDSGGGSIFSGGGDFSGGGSDNSW